MLLAPFMFSGFLQSPTVLSNNGLAVGPKPFQKNTNTMAQTYRRKYNRDVWHFCSNCRHWPKSNYESRKEKPKSGELCDQCSPNARRKTANNPDAWLDPHIKRGFCDYTCEDITDINEKSSRSAKISCVIAETSIYIGQMSVNTCQVQDNICES